MNTKRSQRKLFQSSLWHYDNSNYHKERDDIKCCYVIGRLCNYKVLQLVLQTWAEHILEAIRKAKCWQQDGSVITAVVK